MRVPVELAKGWPNKPSTPGVRLVKWGWLHHAGFAMDRGCGCCTGKNQP